MISGHHPQYRKESLALYRAIRNSKDHPKLKELLSKYTFVAVDAQGNLVGKKRNPILLNWPIGRRRTPTTTASKAQIKKWAQSIPKRKK